MIENNIWIDYMEWINTTIKGEGKRINCWEIKWYHISIKQIFDKDYLMINSSINKIEI